MTAAVPVMAVTMGWAMKLMSTAAEEEATAYAAAGGYAAETLTNLRTVVAFVSTHWLLVIPAVVFLLRDCL